MKTFKILSVAAIAITLASCSGTTKPQLEEKTEILRTQPFEEGKPIQIHFQKGKDFYHPLIVFWIEDTEGNFIETIYASQSIATGTFRFGESEGNTWKPGERRRPAALPYWGHRRGIRAPDGLYLPTPQRPLPDAVTGATPKTNFTIKSFVRPDLERFKIFMEINQTWDWNQYWHNNRFPDDDEYKTNSQPALVFMAEVDMLNSKPTYELKPIGHSHPSGSSGELFSDISTFTTALNIAQRVFVTIE